MKLRIKKYRMGSSVYIYALQSFNKGRWIDIRVFLTADEARTKAKELQNGPN